MWRFWQVLPPKGHVGILFGNWYTDPIVQHALGHDKESRFDERLTDIRAFERLTSEGVRLVKLWFHMTKEGVTKRFKALEKDPKTAWRVTAHDWDRLKHYDTFVPISAKALRKTSTGEAPWLVIDGMATPSYRAITAGQYLLDNLLRAVQTPAPVGTGHAAPPAPPPLDGRSLLATQDYTRALDRATYEDPAGAPARPTERSCCARPNGSGAGAGVRGHGRGQTGSTIRRITQALDARHYRVIPVAAPNEAERAQPYLWRFWRYLRAGATPPCSTAPGMAAYWWSGWGAFAPNPTGPRLRRDQRL